MRFLYSVTPGKKGVWLFRVNDLVSSSDEDSPKTLEMVKPLDYIVKCP